MRAFRAGERRHRRRRRRRGNAPAPAAVEAAADPSAGAIPNITALKDAARNVSSGAGRLKVAAVDFALATPELERLTEAYVDTVAALSEVDAAVRDLVEGSPYLKDVDDLLAVAALSESLREWFPVDPEMTSVRNTVLVPRAMTDTKVEPPDPQKATDKSLDVLFKELLAKLAK